jgi:hypothetical protein
MWHLQMSWLLRYAVPHDWLNEKHERLFDITRMYLEHFIGYMWSICTHSISFCRWHIVRSGTCLCWRGYIWSSKQLLLVTVVLSWAAYSPATGVCVTSLLFVNILLGKLGDKLAWHEVVFLPQAWELRDVAGVGEMAKSWLEVEAMKIGVEEGVQGYEFSHGYKWIFVKRV